MILSVWQRLDMLARQLAPFALTVLLVILGMVPLQIPQFSPVIPSLAIIAVYYWTIHRPDLMPVWAVFLLGLIQDLLGAGPVGVGILALLLVHTIVAMQRRFFASATFMMMWVMFIPVAAAAMVAIWLFSSFFYNRMLDPEPAFFAYLLTVAIYPCLSWLFAQAQRGLLRHT